MMNSSPCKNSVQLGSGSSHVAETSSRQDDDGVEMYLDGSQGDSGLVRCYYGSVVVTM